MFHASVAYTALAAAVILTAVAVVMWLDTWMLFHGLYPLSTVTQVLCSMRPYRAGAIALIVSFAIGMMLGHLYWK